MTSARSTPDHTVGPWVVWRDRNDNSLNVSNSREHGSEFVCMIGRGESTPNMDADAKLISTAPDLLDACEVALGHLTGGMDGDWRNCDAPALLRDVIRKARGK